MKWKLFSYEINFFKMIKTRIYGFWGVFGYDARCVAGVAPVSSNISSK